VRGILHTSGPRPGKYAPLRPIQLMNSNSSLPAAVIFDMDGVLVNSNPFHLRKWVELLREHGIPFEEEKLAEIVLGPPNEVTFQRYFGHLTPEEMHKLSEELEARFRQTIGPHARPLPGVVRLLDECRANGMTMAVASAAISRNVNFIITALKLRPYFRTVLSVNEITHAKPDPEIYLKTAAKLGVKPSACVVCEDSFVGIAAAKAAGMKCLAIASTFPIDDLRRETAADRVVPSFEGVTLATLRGLFDGATAPAGHH